VFTRQLTINENKEDDEERRISMLRTYTVFNEAQIEGLPRTPQAEVIEYTDEEALAFINATQARINHGGNRAYYMPAMDLVWLPSPNDFRSYEHYLATALHELAHNAEPSVMPRRSGFARKRDQTDVAMRHNQSDSRKLSRASSGLYRPGRDVVDATRARAFSLRRMSACM
jgi:antirestriction protein ArdC